MLKEYLRERKNINLIKTLKVDTPWTTGSSDEGSNHYLYYKIQQAKKSKHEYSKFEKIYSFLNKMNIIQVDFHSLMKEYTYNKESNALYQKAKLMLNEAQISHKPSSLLMRRKLKVKSSSTADSIDEKHESYECN